MEDFVDYVIFERSLKLALKPHKLQPDHGWLGREKSRWQNGQQLAAAQSSGVDNEWRLSAGLLLRAVLRDRKM